MDERIEVETPLGPVWLFGRDQGRPVHLILSGAFAASDYLERAAHHFPGVDVLRAHLPGNHCPPLAAISVGAFAAAYSAALRSRFAGRPVVATGVSVGGLVALGLKTPELRRLVVVEPPLQPHRAWPFRLFREQTPPGGEAFVRNVVGVDASGSEPRDYTPLLEGLTTPTLALLGDVALGEPRPFDEMPSLVDDDSRRRLAAHPLVEVRAVPGVGHNIPLLAADLFLDAMLRACRAGLGLPAEPGSTV
jgi:pimeloyl-ACP methyl ester carboxylesterase